MKTYRLENGTFVGTQAEIPKGDAFTTVEVPTNPKEELLKFLNELQSQPVTPIRADDSPPSTTSPLPQSTEAEQTYARFRADVVAGRNDLEDTLWKAPLEVCLRLASIIYERTHEHYVKEKQNENRSKSI